ncbi:glycoside hydrolase family 127 protein [Marilutibacter alkalisoli]|uniref:Glycosyl hydrolase n=1 Tax=Marilutibacter alkalisoli TaxID=2591633 RepID=A0A514BV62_9GAMM|nr:glycoside hydrolase family 127 protein [Lysobacter alkalisoli]QDH71256.1 glycosyl hydrolase [Lysobacter alkalisoli]
MSIDHANGFSRRDFVKSLALAAAIPRLAWAGSAAETGTGGARMFSLADIQLGEGVFAHSHALNRRYLAALAVDRLVAPYRIEAALAPRASKYPNWESMGLEGHTAGHYLSALAQEAAQGDDEMRQRLDYMIAELAACQQANGDGYVGAVPNGRALWDSVVAGTFDAGSFSLDGAWVPFYNLHKMFAGLRDAWSYARNRQARQMLIAFTDWADRLVAGLDEQQMQALLATEHGGMNEVLADVYAITGERRYLALARRFSHHALLQPLLRREDALDGMHANTQIPKVIGFARIGELDGDQAWIDAAAFFWETVVRRRSIAFGGNSVREHFNPVDDFSAMVGSPEGPETCNSYNMLRLSAQLYRLDPQPRYADFYERTLFNHILSTQHPRHGGLVYFTPIRPRHYRVYSQPEQCFWCCVGTGIENHGRHGAFAYAHDRDSLTVNLYMASQLQWRERGLVLRQDTRFPDEETSRLALQLREPQRFRLRLRHPHWLEGALEVRINGKPWPLRSTPSSYADIEREWLDGDVVEIDLPMRTRAEGLPDGSDYVALMHGPIVLAARTGTEDLDGLIADDGRGSHITPGPLLPLDQAPVLVGDRNALARQVKAVPGRPLTFEAGGLIRPATFKSLQLEPLFRVHDARYVVYWRTATASAYPALVSRIEADERQRQALQDRTLDRVAPGEQQPEVEHQYQGEDSRTGIRIGRHWRDTGRWMSYRLKARAGTDPAANLELLLAFYGGDHNEGFDLLVDGRRLETIRLHGGANDTFVEHRVALPQDIAQAAVRRGITVKLVAFPGRRTSGLFDLRLLRSE